MQFFGSGVAACVWQSVEQPALQLVSQLAVAVLVQLVWHVVYTLATHAVWTFSGMHSVMHASFFRYSHLASEDKKILPHSDSSALAGAAPKLHATQPTKTKLRTVFI